MANDIELFFQNTVDSARNAIQDQLNSVGTSVQETVKNLTQTANELPATQASVNQIASFTKKLQDNMWFIIGGVILIPLALYLVFKGRK